MNRKSDRVLFFAIIALVVLCVGQVGVGGWCAYTVCLYVLLIQCAKFLCVVVVAFCATSSLVVPLFGLGCWLVFLWVFSCGLWCLLSLVYMAVC